MNNNHGVIYLLFNSK